ncbi:Oidioi.mRNA.OKI2018_I69.PAR.g9225.t1.cds [Oikopleura dioica]|uniref:Oidioi.mRNA.OKI2018_I69.PAR.g9225.t1.cds n=1 Tax=Oikopleura dioica TaxID=34765 RepID=A0ABN7RJM1_OIKDI|nr:Oidioi.mRNA.OKI2018_I69.PAR.g9225.t1.cds [Oikopleura dioica]
MERFRENFGKDSKIILLEILTGAVAWIIMASLPYTKMIYTGGYTIPFHIVLAFEVISWLVSILTLLVSLPNKSLAIINVILGVFFLLAALISSVFSGNFSLGRSRFSASAGIGDELNSWRRFL